MRNSFMKKRIVLTLSSLMIAFSLISAVNANSEEGDIAPDFTIKRFDGSEFKLSEYRGQKSVYIVFWTTWCTYCMKKIPKLQHAAQVFDKQIEVLAVNTSVKDTFAKALRFEKERNIQYPLAFDFGKKVTDLYDVWGTPTEFIIDINGKIIHRDDIPDNLSEHLSNWNMIDYTSSERRVLAKSNCDKEERNC